MAVTKQIEWAGDIDSRIEFCCNIIGVTSPMEISILKEIYKLNNGAVVPLDPSEKGAIAVKLGLHMSTFSTGLTRLMTKKAVMKLNKNYKLHPIFLDLHTIDSITIKWKV